MRKQYIIELIGMDGSGKTSIAQKIAENVYNNYHFCFINGFQIRSFSDELESIALKHYLQKRAMFSDDLANISWMMDLFNTYFKIVQPLYDKGESIIFDRYIFSAKTYSTATTDSDISNMFYLYDFLPQPDAYIYLKVDVDVAYKRIIKRGKNIVYYEAPKYLKKIKECYEKNICGLYNTYTVDANQDFDTVFNEINRILNDLTGGLT